MGLGGFPNKTSYTFERVFTIKTATAFPVTVDHAGHGDRRLLAGPDGDGLQPISDCRLGTTTATVQAALR